MLARPDGADAPTATVPVTGGRRRRLWIAGAVATVVVAAAVYFWTSLFIVCACAPPIKGLAGNPAPAATEGLASAPPAGNNLRGAAVAPDGL